MYEHFDLEEILKIEKELLHPNHIILQVHKTSILVVTFNSFIVYTINTRRSTQDTKKSLATIIIVTQTKNLKEPPDQKKTSTIQ